MPRRRYQLTDGDVAVVHRWVRDRFRNEGWPEDWPSLTAWDLFPLDKPTTKKQQKTFRTKLQQWCDRFLDGAQWKQLHALIRVTRRDTSQYRTVRLSRKAHETLHELAKREKLTLSQTVERYLSDALKAPTVQTISPPTPSPKPRKKRAQSQTARADDAVLAPAPWVALTPKPSKLMKVQLWLSVENNNKFVRGRQKAREEIEQCVLERYQMHKRYPDGSKYVLTIPYETDEELDDIVYEILRDAENTADYRHCFIDADVQSLDDPERSW